MRKILQPIPTALFNLKAITFSFAFMAIGFVYASSGPLTVTVTGENPSCFGIDDGSATAIADGGWEPFTYLWNTGDTTSTITGLGPGTYTVTVTDIDLAIAIGSITLVSDSLTYTTNSNFETCPGSSDAFAAVFPSGGTPPYTYQWDTPNADTSWVAENLSAGTYNVTITDQNGCSIVATIVVELSPEGLWLMTTGTDATCANLCDGTAYVGAMTGTSPYTYIWDDPDMQTTAEAVGLCPGQYFVTVTDDNGCSAIDSIIIDGPPEIIIDLDVTDFDCQSGDLGSITANVSGGTPPYSYEWSTSDTTATISDLTAGIYSLTITDANNCEASDTAEITGANPDAGTLTADGPDVCLENGSAQLVAIPNGDAVIPSGYEVIYVLTSGPGLLIEDTNTDPEFTVTSGGSYKIHTLVYDPATLDLTTIIPGVTTGFEVNGLLVQGGGDICAALDVDGADFNVEDPDAGTITADADNVCLENGNATISATPDGNANVPPGYSTIYVLTSGPGLVIQQANPVPTFTVNSGGLYTIHTLVYDPATFDITLIDFGVTTGFDVNGLLVQGGGDICASLDVTGAPVVVEDPDAGTITADASPVCLENGSADISATPDGNANVPSGYSTIYVLTSGPGLVIEQTNATPDFTVTEIGLYTIHTLVYDPATLDLSTIMPGVTTGFDVNGLLVQGGGDICASLDVTGAQVIVEDCGPCVNIGDYVWYDINEDGIQQDSEEGLAGFTVQLFTAGPDGTFGTSDDVQEASEYTNNDGYYLFECVPPGEYSILFLPYDFQGNLWLFSPQDQGSDDELDSDADTLTGATDPFVVTATQDDDLSYDAGIYPECIDLTYGGQIGFNQVICAGLVPDTLVDLISPSGGIGPIEYLWMFTTVPGPFNQSTWNIVPNSNTPFLAPGPLGQTTYFIRCSRRRGCDEYVAESNIIIITVVPFDPDVCDPLINNLVVQPVNNGQVSVNWLVMDDQAQFAYIVEKSTNGKDFEDLTILSSKNNGKVVNQYEFIDENPNLGSNFYRVRVQSIGGMLSYSEIKKIVLNNKFSIYPNPVHDHKLYIKSSAKMNKPTKIEVYSSNGVLLKTINLSENSMIDEEISFENLSRGLYFVKIHFGGNLYEVIKVSNVSE